MTFQAKSNLTMMLILAIVYGGYFVVVLNQAANSALDEISWQPLMLLTVIPVVILATITHTVIALLAPSEAGVEDERDQLVDLRGEWLGGFVLAAGIIFGLALTMFEAHVFWIAQVLLGSLVLSEIVKDARTLMLYRRGF